MRSKNRLLNNKFTFRQRGAINGESVNDYRAIQLEIKIKTPDFLKSQFK